MYVHFVRLVLPVKKKSWPSKRRSKHTKGSNSFFDQMTLDNVQFFILFFFLGISSLSGKQAYKHYS